MQHLKDFLHSKKLPVSEILSNFCEITEKVDGSAFQIYNDNGIIIYGKRGNGAHLKSANPITEFDLVMNTLYNDTVTYLSQYAEIFNDYKILNFEIFSTDYNNHIISYENQYKHGIVLLSGYDFNGALLDNDTLMYIANVLDISFNDTVWSGIMSQSFINSLIANKDDDITLWKLISNTFCTGVNTDNVEGFVLNYKSENVQTRILKVQNPDFQNKILIHLADEKLKKSTINLEYIYDMFIDRYININDNNSSLLTKILELYVACELATKDFYNEEKLLKNIDVINQQQINISKAQQYYSFLPNKEDLLYPSLLTFLLLAFRGKRYKFPLWCSLEYQLNKVNKFIDILSNN